MAKKSPLMQWPYVLWLFQCNVYLINSISASNSRAVSALLGQKAGPPSGLAMLSAENRSCFNEKGYYMPGASTSDGCLMFSCFCVAFKSSTSSCVYTYIHEKM